MSIDFWAYVFLGLVQVATGIWGGIVSSRSLPHGRERTAHVGVFVVLCFFGCALTIWSGLRAVESQKAAEREQQMLKSQLNTAQRKLDQTLLSQEYLKGQVNSLATVIGQSGKNTSDIGVIERLAKNLAEATKAPAPRHLNSQQITAMREVLIRHDRGEIGAMMYETGHLEAKDFRDELAKAIRGAGWKVNPETDTSTGILGPDFYGIEIAFTYVERPTAPMVALRDAMLAAGLDVNYREEKIAAFGPNSMPPIYETVDQNKAR